MVAKMKMRSYDELSDDEIIEPSVVWEKLHEGKTFNCYVEGVRIGYVTVRGTSTSWVGTLTLHPGGYHHLSRVADSMPEAKVALLQVLEEWARHPGNEMPKAKSR